MVRRPWCWGSRCAIATRVALPATTRAARLCSESGHHQNCSAKAGSRASLRSAPKVGWLHWQDGRAPDEIDAGNQALGAFPTNSRGGTIMRRRLASRCCLPVFHRSIAKRTSGASTRFRDGSGSLPGANSGVGWQGHMATGRIRGDSPSPSEMQHHAPPARARQGIQQKTINPTDLLPESNAVVGMSAA